jgi:heme exporter protein A
MHAPPRAIEAVGLARAFGRRRAVDGVDFALDPGEALALFGPNGAGKTTLLRMLAGLLRPTAGMSRLAGTVVGADRDARAQVGFISHNTMLYASLTARENVELAARLYGVDDPEEAAARALQALEIAGRSDSAVRSLSRGMQQRVSIARAIVHQPTVVLLDEPYTGLDAAGAAALTGMLRALRSQGAALVLVTHHVHEGLALASHSAVMMQGRIVRYEACDGIDPVTYATSYQALVVRDGTAA